jgi:hypothetical protein
MTKARAQFVGATGQYYVAYELSSRNIIANITIGNAPGVDILATDLAGLNSIAIQVKTSRNAWRNNRYGSAGCEWDVNASAVGRQSVNLWYAFVDLQENQDGYAPRTFIVPSKWVAEFVLPGWSRNIFFLPQAAHSLTLNKWNLINGALENDEATILFASEWSTSLVRWGKND